MVGQAAGQICKMPPKIKECKIALSKQDTVKLDEISEEKNIKKTKPKKGGKVVDNENENDMKKDEIKPVESKDEKTEEKENEKVKKEEVESDIKEVSDKDSKEDKTEDNANVEEDKMEQKNGCHIQHMAGYINNGETFGGDVPEDDTETAAGNLEESVQKKDFSLEKMLFTKETESEKEE